MKQALPKQEKGLGSNLGLAAVFITGGCVLVLEILGTKVISPYYGSTVYVWSSLIALTLLALSLGYAFGGALADRYQEFGLVYVFIALSGLWIALIPLIRSAVLSQTTPLGLIWGSFASAACLFAIPLALLGAVGPMVIKQLSQDLKAVGRSAGSVYAVSTLGSVLGALLTGYWLIPNFSVKFLLWGLSAALLFLAGIGFLGSHRARSLFCWLLALGLVLKTFILKTQAPSTNLLFSQQSFYGEVKVVDHNNTRYLFIDGLHNASRDLKSNRSALGYAPLAEMLPYMRKGAKRALALGLGGGIIPSIFEGTYGIVADAVEIDPVIVKVARNFFDYRPIGEVVVDDGRAYVRRCAKKYDFIVVDVFSGDQQPSHLSSFEFFKEIKAALNPGGIVFINRIGWAQNEPFAVWESVAKTLRVAFVHTRVLTTKSPSETKNIQTTNLLFFASDEKLDFPDAHKTGVSEEVGKIWAQAKSWELVADPKRLEKAPLLTDDFSPLDAWDSPAMAQLRLALIKNAGQVLLY